MALCQGGFWQPQQVRQPACHYLQHSGALQQQFWCWCLTSHTSLTLSGACKSF